MKELFFRQLGSCVYEEVLNAIAATNGGKQD